MPGPGTLLLGAFPWLGSPRRRRRSAEEWAFGVA
jgi:hypothetical protein